VAAVAFETPEPRFLAADPKLIKGKKRFLPWSANKVVTNAARVSLGFWCSIAFAEEEGLLLTQRFHCIWPLVDWSARTIAAVLNGPLANAFISVRENKRDIHGQTLKQLPIPVLSNDAQNQLDVLTRSYDETLSSGGFDDAREILLRIDAIVLAGYLLSETQISALLALCEGQTRPLPFDFGYPADFSERVSKQSETLMEPIGEGPVETFPKELLDQYNWLLEQEQLTDVQTASLTETRAALYKAHLDSPAAKEMSKSMKHLHDTVDENLESVIARLKSL